jgi:co-chaperonin GroES (HSP10)
MNYRYVRNGSKEVIADNESGLVPVEDKLLLLPDEITQQVGLIHVPEVARAQQQMAQTRALLIAIGGNCFEDWGEPHPKPLQRVMVCKYAGILAIVGADGREYQICTDRDITAIIEVDTDPTTASELVSPRQPLSQQGTDASEGGIIT